MASRTTSVPLMKPIRFVTNENGTPYQKRRRISAACTTCRRRKTRCSGERPVCRTCTLGSQRCGGYGQEEESINLTSSGGPARRQSSIDVAADQKETLASPRQAVSMEDRPRTTITIRGDKLDGISRKAITRNRMPYFRYFGPTAIMPGWRQMVVKIGQSSQQNSPSSTSAPSLINASTSGFALPVPSEIPAYDTRDGPVSPLILSLCRTFFVHLGCTFPFLQTERFLHDLRERQVEACLVDAVCALACRFHSAPLVKSSNDANSSSINIPPTTGPLPSDFGPAFAQRAKHAIVDAFGCPSVAVVQAALLIAYDEFGASRDSGLWMYLGIALRMSEDLGMEKIQGLRYEGLSGPTPREFMAKTESPGAPSNDTPQSDHAEAIPATIDEDSTAIAERKAIERERIDTFWAVFFLDRVISSGTGRPVTLRAKHIEIAFPPLRCLNHQGDGWPDPFAALVRVIHLYGVVTDVLNGIKKLSDVTRAIIDRLTTLESHLTTLYQNLSSKLHFNHVNFQHYVRAGQGTNFILLHFWFHTLIVLLHQPTLLQNFEGVGEEWGRSRELSMSSAKTIADILAFAEVIGPGSALGNPFTSQPTYVAACAFLKEVASHTTKEQSVSQSPTSGATGQARDQSDVYGGSDMATPDDNAISPGTGMPGEPSRSASAKHSLLAVTAKENYQKCYGALQSLERYWSGTKYILTVLDQKAKGVADALLYTQEEMECALELPAKELSFTRPGWRRKLSGIWPKESREGVKARNGDKKREAIGWSLTGTMNSPSTSLAVLFPSQNEAVNASHLASVFSDVTSMPSQSSKSQSRFVRDDYPRVNLDAFELSPRTSTPTDPSKPAGYPPSTATPSALADAEILLSLHSPFPTPVPTPATSHKLPPVAQNFPQHPSQSLSQQQSSQQQQHSAAAGMGPFDGGATIMGTFSDGITIQSQDIDVSTLNGWGFGPSELGMGVNGVSGWAESYLPADMFEIGG